MGRTGHQAVALGAIAAMIAAADVAVVLTRGEVPVARAATTATHVSHASLVTPAGRVAALRDGEQVPAGAVVRTSRNGAVQLVTRGRIVDVGPSAAVAVVNGARQQLRTGAAVIDAQHGPGLRVDVAGDALTVPAGSAVQATRSVSVVIGALAGPARLTSASARQLTLPALSQVVISGEALPTSTTPLHLDDGIHSDARAAEARAVPTLVADDLRLTALARGIDTSGSSVAQVVSAAWSAPTMRLPAAFTASERVLPMVIATATTAAGGTVEQRYRHVVDWRRAGGSWGVVVELLSGHAAGVETELAAMQRSQPPGRIGAFAIRALAAPVRVHAAAGGHQPAPGGSSPRPPPPASQPPSGDNPRPTPGPSPSKGPVRKLVGTVTGVVGGVVGLLPKPKPSPSHSSGGLLGGLLNH